ncbi:Sortase (surface protein transpeptidase) [Micrococcus luteus]|uniref:class F sortase n=1 Tax=Micrococcus luteus TaxID=1270 RepID=UPI000DFE893A|nr:class F sortase [Micrococcus luteus]STY72602.1 Sortase (surface protein transpeptidase) [Micrococcus luteus]
MNTTVRRALWVVLVLLCLGLVFLALRGMLAVGAVPISAAPTLSATASATPSPSSSSARPTSSPAPTATPSPSSASPTREAAVPVETQEPAGTPTPSEEPTPTEESTPTEEPAPAAAAHLSGPAAPWDEITATPVHVDVHQDGEQIVGAGIDLTQLDEGGDLDPEPQTVGWYGPPQWGTTPGERSPYAGVLAGHVVYYGVRDVFWNLGDVRAGAVVVVTYDDGTQAAFEADADAVSVEKEALTQDPANRWAWEPGGDDAKVTLITCDLVPGTGMAGNAFNNWVVQATRVA